MNCPYTCGITILPVLPFPQTIESHPKSTSANTTYLPQPNMVKKVEMKWLSKDTLLSVCSELLPAAGCSSSQLLVVQTSPSSFSFIPLSLCYLWHKAEEWVAEVLLSICLISFMNLDWICFFVSQSRWNNFFLEYNFLACWRQRTPHLPIPQPSQPGSLDFSQPPASFTDAMGHLEWVLGLCWVTSSAPQLSQCWSQGRCCGCPLQRSDALSLQPSSRTWSV